MPPKKIIIALAFLVSFGVGVVVYQHNKSIQEKTVPQSELVTTTPSTEYIRIQDKYAKTECLGTDSQAELSSCLQRNLKLFDETLNEVYVKVKNLCSGDIPSCTKELLSAQQAWVAFRDESCVLESRQSYGGSAYDDYLTGCLIGYTRERTVYLEQFLGNP